MWKQCLKFHIPQEQSETQLAVADGLCEQAVETRRHGETNRHRHVTMAAVFNTFAYSICVYFSPCMCACVRVCLLYDRDFCSTLDVGLFAVEVLCK